VKKKNVSCVGIEPTATRYLGLTLCKVLKSLALCR